MRSLQGLLPHTHADVMQPHLLLALHSARARQRGQMSTVPRQRPGDAAAEQLVHGGGRYGVYEDKGGTPGVGAAAGFSGVGVCNAEAQAGGGPNGR